MVETAVEVRDSEIDVGEVSELRQDPISREGTYQGREVVSQAS